MGDIKHYIPDDIIKFLQVLLFSLLIGLEQRRHHIEEPPGKLFGTDRTFTFIGLLGYVLFIADKVTYIPFIAGLVIVGLLLAVYYHHRIITQQKNGITTIVLALLTYCLPVVVFTQPIWVVFMFLVSILIVTGAKANLLSFSKKITDVEFITLGKFIAFTGIMLPLLPHENISEWIPFSPFQVWLSVVVVSAISYCSYLLKKYIFPRAGAIITGLLGGLYSSTATTVVLLKKEKNGELGPETASAVMLTLSMMYLRILILTLLFNAPVALDLSTPFAALFLVTLLMAWALRDKKTKPAKGHATRHKPETDNPLEFKAALIFGLIFIAFGAATAYAVKTYGGAAVTGIAFIAGVTDIDPFLLSVLEQTPAIDTITIVLAVLNATNSNNIFKMILGLSVCSPTMRKKMIAGYGVVIGAGLIASMIFYFLIA